MRNNTANCSERTIGEGVAVVRDIEKETYVRVPERKIK